MRLATITNWAYGATVCLTAVSGGAMLFASHTQEREREAVEQRYQLDRATSRISTDVYALTDHARQYVSTGDETYRMVYERDHAFRYGGEEFTVLLPGVEWAVASRRAEDIRAAIARLRVLHDGESLGPITASIGVASIPEHGALSELVQAADRALLTAKEGGRDRVEVATIRRPDRARQAG